MVEYAHDLIRHYGYAGLLVALVLGIVGLPLPDETLLAAAGVLVHRGELSPVPTLLVALAGSCGGITLSFVIGRTLGCARCTVTGRTCTLRRRGWSVFTCGMRGMGGGH